MMKVWDNGVVRDETEKEIAERQASIPEVDQEPTTEERLAALEAAMLEQILRSVSGD